MDKEPMGDAVDVFVYGSLLSGEANHGLLREATFAGPARTPPAYRLVDLGPYPGMLANGKTAILGEVYRAPQRLMPALDQLEEHPDVYVRTEIRLEDGRAVVTYLLHEHLAAGKPEVPLGDWRTHLRTRRKDP
jgi:gamma-glutamylcyclotransferase (GGCT)/AIG2-like uncharacterized protein YtfP